MENVLNSNNVTKIYECNLLLPNGNWKNSARNIEIKNNLLVAELQDKHGFWISSSTGMIINKFLLI